jgi:hypothetical protein
LPVPRKGKNANESLPVYHVKSSFVYQTKELFYFTLPVIYKASP